MLHGRVHRWCVFYELGLVFPLSPFPFSVVWACYCRLVFQMVVVRMLPGGDRQLVRSSACL